MFVVIFTMFQMNLEGYRQTDADENLKRTGTISYREKRLTKWTQPRISYREIFS